VLDRVRHRIIQVRFRADAWRSRLLRPGTPEYRRRTGEEIEHYCEKFSTAGRLFEPAPPVWEELQRRVAELVRRATGHDVTGYVASRLAALERPRMISLGSGAGGVELVIAREVPRAGILCLDLNPDLLEIARKAARREGLNLQVQQADLNLVELPEKAFDLVFCHASLHHVLELEHLVEQIRRTLRPGGELVIVEIVTRNGYRMWPETRRVAQAIWHTLPERYRVNHTAYPEPRVDQRLWEWDTRATGMECLRSEEIVPLLDGAFEPVYSVPHFALCRRFFDTMYGPNYDLERPLDRAIVDWIWELDRYYLESGRLRGETLFGVWRKRD